VFLDLFNILFIISCPTLAYLNAVRTRNLGSSPNISRYSPSTSRAQSSIWHLPFPTLRVTF
jgi:hypothetical protein